MTRDRAPRAPGPSPDGPTSGVGFAERARLAVGWTVGFQFFRDALQFVLMLVLVRLLPPEVYGQFGFISALLTFLTLLSFREFVGYTLLAREGEVHYQDHFTAGAVLQGAVFLVTNAVAVGLRWTEAYAGLAPVLHVMSLLFLLDLPSELRVKMLERRLDWRRRRVLHGVGLVVGGAFSIGLALAGWGVYALLLPTLVVPVLFAWDLFARAGWRPTWTWQRQRFAAARRFGLSRVFSQGIGSAAQFVESWWLSAAVGFAAFGVFGRAIALAQLCCGRVAELLATSMFPVLARIDRGSDTYRTAGALYLRSVTWLVVPAATIVGLLAGPVVAVLYGDQWEGVVPLVPWAMGAVAATAVVRTAYTLLLAHGRQDRCLVADAWKLVGTIGSLALLLPGGVALYLGGLAVTGLVAATASLRWLVLETAIDRPGVYQALVPPCVATLVAAAGYTVVHWLGDAVSGLVVEGLAALVFGFVYLAVLRIAFAGPLQELVARAPARHRLNRLLLMGTANGQVV